MRISLKFLLALLLFGFALLATLVSFIISKQQVTDRVTKTITKQLLNDLNLIQSEFERYIIYGQAEGISQSVAAKSSEIDTLLLVVTSPNGKVRASTSPVDIGKYWKQLNYEFNSKQYQRVLEKNTSSVWSSTENQWIDGMVPICQSNFQISLRNQQCGVAIYRKDLTYKTNEVLQGIITQSVYIGIGSIIGAIFILIITHYLITERVIKIKNILIRWIGGERDVQIQLNINDELSDIASLINELVQRFSEEEEALQRSEQLKQAIINSANYSIIATSPEGIITSFNKSAEYLLGFKAEELVNKKNPEAFHDKHEVSRKAEELKHRFGIDVQPGFDVFVAIPSMGEVYEDEWTYVHKNGDKIPVHLSITALFNEQGDIEGYLSIAYDISAKKKNERDLYLAEKVFNNTNEAIMITDENLNIVNINQAYCSITGFSKNYAIGKKANIAYSGKHDKLFYEEMWQKIAHENHWSGEIWNRRKDGEIFPTWLTINTVRGKDNRICNYIGLFKDITQQKLAAEELEKLAYYDQLTQLPNRVLFNERLDRMIIQANRENKRFALMYMDLNRFKYVNDTYGHEIGDELLIQVAQRLTKSVRESDTVARLGGDEFTIILSEQKELINLNDITGIANKLINVINQPFMINNLNLYVGTSIGISIYPNDGTDTSSLCKNADTAMYKAKESAAANYKFFAEYMNKENHSRLELESALRSAMKNNEFSLHYQPIINITNQKILGFEALLRWQHPHLGNISPEHFIPIAEDLGLINELGDWVFCHALEQLREWKTNISQEFYIAINLSAKQLQSNTLVTSLVNTIEEYQINPQNIHIEITETSVISDPEMAVKKLKKLRDIGFKISIDDFGTGQSSLNYLKKFPINTIKIDKTFVKSAESDQVDMAIVKAVLSIAESMDLAVVAEGVETKSQEKLLLGEGCKIGQGYLYSKPLPASQVKQLFNRKLRLVE
ncbi:EAL and GGDEF domain-containing protein [Aliikangiella maris]|uniref:EAL domain-containing protein n=2 Tax=Aliikangiella maris TaxID=3162458 RepID=A0ABV2BTF1_9GAMM